MYTRTVRQTVHIECKWCFDVWNALESFENYFKWNLVTLEWLQVIELSVKDSTREDLLLPIVKESK